MHQRIWDSPDQADVLAACEILLEELQDAIDSGWAAVANAASVQDSHGVTRAMERAKSLTALKGDAEALRRRLRDLLGAPAEGASAAGTYASQKLQKGLKTPQPAYRVPILQALVDLGGSADKNAALERVYATLRGRLNEYDTSPVPSDPKRPRWKVTAEFCRNNLREEGLVAAGSPKGLWEITDAGRRWLAAQTR